MTDCRELRQSESGERLKTAARVWLLTLKS